MKNSEFRPFVPANTITTEFTVTSIIVGIIVAIVFGAANAYLGLRVGMTISASIPAAVIAMVVIRIIFKKDSVLESNMVQTIGSAGESVASGTIFTLPALFLWANEGIMDLPSLLQIVVIAIAGGVLGVLFMVPLRNALIVEEHGILPYPEGTACAEVLLAGENDNKLAKNIFAGMGISAAVKFLVDGFRVVGSTITAPIRAFKTELSAEVYPALIGVGYICGPRVASYMFAGGIISWLVLIPALVLWGGENVIYPQAIPISVVYETGGPDAIWNSYIRYIGAGAVAAGGMLSLIRTLPLIMKTFVAAVKGIRTKKADNSRLNQSLSIKTIGITIVITILLIWILPQIPINLAGAILIAVVGFFVAAVSSRMVGIVGSSNNPVSGMTIAALLITVTILKMTGTVGTVGMISSITIGAIVCVIGAVSADTSQDLKTGYLLGATPKKQQIGELIGVAVASLAIGGVLYLLNSAWGFGGEMIPAPQATLMKLVVEGAMNGELPWKLMIIGAAIVLTFEIVGINALPVAIGMYLPCSLSITVMIGGLIRLVVDKMRGNAANDADRAILFCSGLIAGEGLVGILLAVFAVTGIDKVINISDKVQLGQFGSICLMIVLVVLVLSFCNEWKKKK